MANFAVKISTLARGVLYSAPRRISFASFGYSTESTSFDNFDKLVKESKVVVFMKGVPDAPRCGFSNAVVQILRMHGVEYSHHDVLENESIRQGIKKYTNWPTIPQIFINGDFVGGCDILLQMHQSGELIDELRKVGIKSAVVDKPPEGEQKQP